MRDLVVASWETDRETVERVLPAGLEPAEVDGRFVVSVAAFRVEGGRLGSFPLVPYSQLNVRVYVTREADPAVFFLASRVTAAGLPGVLLGAPVRYARVAVRAGSVRAAGLGISLRYRVGEPTEAGLLGRHELGIVEANGLRVVRIGRGETSWCGASLIEPARAEFLVSLGFALGAEPELLFAGRSCFEARLPPEKLE